MDPKKIRPVQKAIQERFFQAFDALRTTGKIKSIQSFCNEHGLHRAKYSRLLNHAADSYKIIDVDALSYLVQDYGISAGWLLTGHGEMFR